APLDDEGRVRLRPRRSSRDAAGGGGRLRCARRCRAGTSLQRTTSLAPAQRGKSRGTGDALGASRRGDTSMLSSPRTGASTTAPARAALAVACTNEGPTAPAGGSAVGEDASIDEASAVVARGVIPIRPPPLSKHCALAPTLRYYGGPVLQNVK